MKTSHKLYLDDSGTKEYASDPLKYEGRTGISRHFVFGGVLLSLDTAAQLSSDIIRLKLDYFGGESVELKSNWLRNRRQQRLNYLEPYRISEDDLTEFVDEFYRIVSGADFMLIATVVDKLHVQESYPDPWPSHRIAYELMLQRVERELAAEETYSVTCDQMERGNEDELKELHEELKRSGSVLKRGMQFNQLKGRLRFVDSAHSHLVQLADIAAYNVLRQFRDHGDAWEDGELDLLPEYEYFARIASKFRRGPQNRIQGYGVVKFPLRRRRLWVYVADNQKRVTP